MATGKDKTEKLAEKLQKYGREELLEVWWQDIVTWGGWTAETDLASPPETCVSFGFVNSVKKYRGKWALVLSGTLGYNSTIHQNQHISIPIATIESVTKVKTVKKTKDED